MTSARLSRERILAVREMIRSHVRVTPVVRVDGADFGLPPFPLTLKLEQLQHAGSFKARGAFSNLLTRPVPAAGVVAASGGNHGAAVAHAARRLGIAARIFVPVISSAAKIQRIRDAGAELVVVGERYADALAASEAWRAESGAIALHAFDALETLLGPATLAAEFEEQAPELDTVLAAVGGGGLLGGMLAWYAGRVKLVGVEPEGAPTLHLALAAGKPVDAPTDSIAADSLAPRQVGALMFPLAQRYGSGVRLVPDSAIQDAQRALWDVLRIVAEPGGAAAFAALLSGAYQPAPGERVGVVISGGNTTAVQL
jgi:threonine dehydratase